MDAVTSVLATGLLLVAIGISSRRYNVWVVLLGLGLVALGFVMRILAGGGLLTTGIGLFRDAGLALIVAALWLKIRKPLPGARPFFLLGIVSLALAGTLFLVRSLVRPIDKGPVVSLLVELGPDDTVGEIVPILESFGATAERAFPTVGLLEDEDLAQIHLVHVRRSEAEDLMDALRADQENVDFVEENANVALPPLVPGTSGVTGDRTLLENDPLAGEQWALEAISGHEVHAMLQQMQPARKAKVAILDTGIEHDHEDLEAIVVTPGSLDDHGHGTHCAGIAGAATNNGLGVASLNWEGRFVELMAFQALGDAGRGTLEQIAQAIIDATQAGADVISMSLGSAGSVRPRVLVTAVAYALRHDVIVAASAGNSNEDGVRHFPSNIEGVIAVAAVDRNLDKARFSNTVGGLSRPLAAPGVDILSSHLKGTYKPLSGTSMATPLVAGLVGIMRSVSPGLSAADAYQILHETGTTVAATPQVGRVINAEAALRAALAL